MNNLRPVVIAMFLGSAFGSAFACLLTSCFVSEPKFVAAQEADEGDQNREITAASFKLVDKAGKVRATLDIADGGGARFSIVDESGQPRVLIMEDGDKAGITTYGTDKEGKRASARLFVDGGTPNLDLASSTQGSTISLSIIDEKVPRLYFMKTGKAGTTRVASYAALQVSEEGSLLVLAPPHPLEGDKVPEDPPANSLLAGRVDVEKPEYGLRLRAKDKDVDWPASK